MYFIGITLIQSIYLITPIKISININYNTHKIYLSNYYDSHRKCLTNNYNTHTKYLFNNNIL